MAVKTATNDVHTRQKSPMGRSLGDMCQVDSVLREMSLVQHGLNTAEDYAKSRLTMFTKMLEELVGVMNGRQRFERDYRFGRLVWTGRRLKIELKPDLAAQMEDTP